MILSTETIERVNWRNAYAIGINQCCDYVHNIIKYQLQRVVNFRNHNLPPG